MNFEHNIWRTFDRACRKIAQMVMATDLPREDPIGSERTRSEFCTNVTEDSTSANSMDHRHSPSKNNAYRTKSTASSGSGDSEVKEKNELALTNGPLGRSAELTAGQDGCSPNSQVLQLRQLLLLHLELIQQQQEQLQLKDKELNQLKIDKEQLEARIHRMERRMAMKKRHGNDEEDDIYSTEPPGGKTKAAKVPKRRQSSEQLIRSKRVPIQAPVVMTSSMCDDRISYDTHLRTETLYLSHHASISPSALVPELVLPVVPIVEVLKEKKEMSPIAVPSWAVEDLEETSCSSTSSTTSLQLSNTTKSIAGPSISEEIEDLDDEAFGKRHAKHELDEKRRKRWDIQRMRSLTYHETLEKKHLEREQARLKGRKAGKEQKDGTQEFMLSFQPKPEGILALEVSDTVPVVAFGSAVPLFHSKEFDLPWFSLEKRVLQERSKVTRGSGRGRIRSRRRSNYR